MRILFAAFAGTILIGLFVGPASEPDHRLRLIALIGVIAGGLIATFVGQASTRPINRFLAGALVGVATAYLLVMVALPGIAAYEIGYIIGSAIANWAILGGCCALLLRALPPIRRATGGQDASINVTTSR